MQTSKIKVDSIYAYKRGGEYVRFVVDAIITRKSVHKTESEIEGRIVEDAGNVKIRLDPGSLEGPYEEMAALVERKAKEDAERKTKQEAADAKARKDRLTLYRFIGVPAPKDVKAYEQPFRIDYGATVDIRREGVALLIERIEKLEAEKPKLSVVPKESA